MQREQRTKLQETPPTAPSPEPAPGMARGVVAKGRSIDIGLPTKKIVGSRPIEIGGVTVYKDVEAAEQRKAQPGDIVELPEAEIERLRGLGFLVAPDAPAKRGNGKAAVNPVTGVPNDPRLTAAR
jgi:hypothetical protein